MSGFKGKDSDVVASIDVEFIRQSFKIFPKFLNTLVADGDAKYLEVLHLKLSC